MDNRTVNIGDWIYSSLEEKPIQITIEILDSISYGYDDGLEYIPLTEEILKKNGFEDDTEYGDGTIDYIWYNQENGFSLSKNSRNDKAFFPWMYSRMKLNYVHELQHLLRLCGLNELADNFKV